MIPAHLITPALEAVEDIMKRVLGVKPKLDPLKPKHFDLMVERLAQALRRVTAAEEDRAIASTLEALNLDYSKVTPARLNRAIGAAKTKLGAVAESVAPAVRASFALPAKTLVADTRASVIRRFDLDLGVDLSLTDQKIIDYARDTTSLFVRDAYGLRAEEFSVRARELVASGLEQGLGRDAIASSIAEAVTEGSLARGLPYFRMVSATFSSRARAYAELSSLREAEVTQWMWDATGDMATCKICMFLNGQVFSVERAAAKMDEVLELSDPEDVAGATPFVRADNEGLWFERAERKHRIASITEGGGFESLMDGDELMVNGISIPVHPDCRCTPVMI